MGAKSTLHPHLILLCSHVYSGKRTVNGVAVGSLDPRVPWLLYVSALRVRVGGSPDGETAQVIRVSFKELWAGREVVALARPEEMKEPGPERRKGIADTI